MKSGQKCPVFTKWTKMSVFEDKNVRSKTGQKCPVNPEKWQKITNICNFVTLLKQICNA